MLFEKKIVGFYQSVINGRADDTGAVHYFTHGDFEGLCALPYEFAGAYGQRLVGAFYYYGNMSAERIVIFEHGMGGGHLSYMKEIEKLASHGYTVLSYDHTGCMQSEGNGIGGFAESLSNLDSLIKSLKADERYKNHTISVIGHSWGGFSTLNISAFHKDVTHVVAISGFTSVNNIVKQFFKGPLRLYVPAVMRLERARNPEYCDTDASLSLKSSATKALIIHSEDDKTVSCKKNASALKQALLGRENTRFIILTDRDHNPNYTPDAVKYKGEFFVKLTEFLKSEDYKNLEKRESFKGSFDFERMTKQDDALWQEIFAFLDN